MILHTSAIVLGWLLNFTRLFSSKQRKEPGPSTGMPAHVLIWHRGVPLFNAAFSWNRTSRKWMSLARPYHTWKQARLCGVQLDENGLKGFAKTNIFYYAPDAAKAADYVPTELPPTNVRCQVNGETKLVTVDGDFYVYGHTHKNCPKHMGRNLPPPLEAMFLASAYRNWITPWRHQATDRAAHYTKLMHWAIQPERDNPTAKNFVFFAQNRTQYLVTLMEPAHIIYQLNPHTGFMSPAFSTPASLGFPHGIRTSLSAGTVPGPPGLTIAVAHLSMGGWVGAFRKPFFYAFSSLPPFKIRCATPAIFAGLSDTLEYPMHLERQGKSLYLSLGIDNCWSALIRLSVSSVMEGCWLPKELRSTHILRVGRNGGLQKQHHSYEPIWKGDHALGLRKPITGVQPGKRPKLLPCKGKFCPTKRYVALEHFANSSWPVLEHSGSQNLPSKHSKQMNTTKPAQKRSLRSASSRKVSDFLSRARSGKSKGGTAQHRQSAKSKGGAAQHRQSAKSKGRKEHRRQSDGAGRAGAKDIF